MNHNYQSRRDWQDTACARASPPGPETVYSILDSGQQSSQFADSILASCREATYSRLYR